MGRGAPHDARAIDACSGRGLALGVAGAVLPIEDTKGNRRRRLRPPRPRSARSAFAAIADERTRAIALFQEAAKVITIRAA